MNTSAPAPEERPIPIDDPTFWDDVREERTLKSEAEVFDGLLNVLLNGDARLWIITSIDKTTNSLTLREYLPNTLDMEAVISRIQGTIEFSGDKT